MEKISEVRSALKAELSGNEARLRFVNTRLILSIGVDLFDDGQETAKAVLATKTLLKMGFLKGTEAKLPGGGR